MDITIDRDEFRRLKEREALFSAITEKSTSFVVVHDRDSVITYVSPSAQLYGYEPSDLLGKIPQDFIHPGDWPLLDGVIQRSQVRPGQTIGVGDIRAAHKDGRWLWFAGQLTCLYDHPGIDGVMFIGHDITGRKKAEETSLQLKLAIEHSGEGVAICDADGCVQFVNSAWAKMHGWRQGDLLGRHISVFHTPGQMRKDVIPFNQVLRSRGVNMGEVGHVRRDGEEFIAWHSGAAISDGRGGISAFMAVIHDITAEKSIQTALKESEEKYRNLVEQSLQGIAIMRNDPLDLVYCNKALGRLLGCSKEALMAMEARALRSWVHPEDRPKSAAWWRDQWEGRPSPAQFEVRVVRENGSVIWLETAAQLITYEGETSLLTMCHDMTDRHKLEESLRHAHKMEAVGTLAGGIAHNLNNILYPIMGYTEMAADDIPEGSPARRNMDEVLVAVNRAKDLVQQILAFSRKVRDRRKPTEMAPIIREVARLMQAVLPSTIQIEQNINSQCPAVMADPNQVREAALNLCTNAFDAMRLDGGGLEIALENVELTLDDLRPDFALPPGEYARLKIKDTGCGVPSNIKDRIFEPYFTTKEVGEGAGMGLAVVHAFAKNSGGAVRVESECGQGALFEVYLPALDRRPKDGAGADPAPNGTESILLVDDDVQILTMNTMLLERLGYRVTGVESGLEAYELFKDDPDRFDLVITDMTMPHLTGDRLAGRLMEIRPDLPVILCTGFSENISEERARKLGMAAYVTKPMAKKDIAEAIRKALDGS